MIVILHIDNGPGEKCRYLMDQSLLSNRTGKIYAVSLSDRKGVVKHNVPAARLLAEHGLEGDAHAEGGCRQVSLLSLASIHKMVAMGA
ncbi:MAG: hypothetical protein ABSA09_14410, partial [Desulfobaccales bacterium]